MHRSQPPRKENIKDFNKIESDLQTDITINNNNERYGADRRFSIAYSDDIEQLLSNYLNALQSGAKTMGVYLAQYIARHQIDINKINTLELYQAILRTRLPVIFAERDAKFDGSDWNEDEYHILALASNTTEVLAYGNGSSGYKTAIDFKFHDKPQRMHLLHCYGPILKEGLPDYKNLVKNGNLQYHEYYEDIREKWLPELLKFNASVGQAGKKGIAFIPGIGCGEYAGEFRGIMGIFLNQAIIDILQNYNKILTNIIGVVFDPFDECEGHCEEIGHIKYCVAPSAKEHPQPLKALDGKVMVLAPLSSTKERIDFFRTLYPGIQLEEDKIVLLTKNPGDLIAGIGCDVVAGHKVTGDGRNVGDTDAMAVHTGEEGVYDKHPGSSYLQARYSRYKSLKKEQEENEDQGYGTIFLRERDELLPVNKHTVTRTYYEKLPPPSHFNIKSSDALYLKRLYKQPLIQLMDKVKQLSEAEEGKEKIKLKKEFLVDALKLNETTLAMFFEPRIGCDTKQIIDYLYDLSEENLEVFLDCFFYTAKSFEESIEQNQNNEFSNKLSNKLRSLLTHLTVWNNINASLSNNTLLFLPNIYHYNKPRTININPIIPHLDFWGVQTTSTLFSAIDTRIIATLLEYSHQVLLSFNSISITHILPSMSYKLYRHCNQMGSKETLYDAIRIFDVNESDAAEQYYEYYHIIASNRSKDGKTYRIYMLVPDDMAENDIGKKKCNKLVEFLFQENNRGSDGIRYDITYAEKRLETAEQFKDQISRVVFDLSHPEQATYLDTKELAPYMKDYVVKYKYSDTDQALPNLQNRQDDQKYRESYEKIFREKATQTLINLYYYEQTLDTKELDSYKKSDAPGKDIFIQHLENLTKRKIEEILQQPISMWNFLLMMESIPIARKAEQAAQEIRAMDPDPDDLLSGRRQPSAPTPQTEQDEVPVILGIGIYKEQMAIIKLGMDIPVRQEWKKAEDFISWLKMNGILGMNCNQEQMRLSFSPGEEKKFFETWGRQFNVFEKDTVTIESMPCVALSFRQWEQLKSYYTEYIQKKSSSEEQLFYRAKLLHELGTTFGLLGQRTGILEQKFNSRNEVTKEIQKKDFYAFYTFKKVLKDNKTKKIDQETISVFKKYIRAYITLNYSMLSSQQINALTLLSNNDAYANELISTGKEYTGFLDLIDIMFDEKLISKVPHYNLLIADLKAQFPQYQNHKELAIRLRTFSDHIGSQITGKIKESLLKKQKPKTQSFDTIRVKQYEKETYDYIYTNKKGDVFIFAPVLRGHMIGTDNTCHAKDEFHRFVNGVQISIQNAINDISQDIKILETTHQSQEALKLKTDKKISLEKWKTYFDHTPLNQNQLYEDIKKKFNNSNVVTILQHPYSQDSYLNLGTLPPHDPHPEPGYTSAFNRSDKSCANDLFAQLSRQPVKQGLLEKIKFSVLRQYKKENLDKDIDSEQGIQSLKETIINILKTEYQYTDIPKFKMGVNVSVVGGKFIKGEQIDITFENIAAQLEVESIPAEYAFDSLLNEKQDNWDKISFEIRNRNLFLTEDWKKFGAIAQFYVNSLVALHYSKGGKKISLGEIIETKHRKEFIEAVVNAYNRDESFVNPILKIVAPYISKKITPEEAHEFFYKLFQIIDGSMHYDDFLLLTDHIEKNQTNFIIHKSRISINMKDVGRCPEEYKNHEFIPERVDLESNNATQDLYFQLNPEDYLAKTPNEIASFLLLDVDEDTKVWKIVSDEFIGKLSKHKNRESILKAISQNPYVSASQYTAILQRFGIVNVLDIDKQMFTWLYNICLIKDPNFLYEIYYLKPSQQLSKSLEKLGCAYQEKPVGPDKDGHFSARCNIAKMRSVIEDAADSRDCLYLHQALVSSIYKLASSLMTEEERQKFDQLSPKDETQINDHSKIVMALKFIFSGSKYDIQPDSVPYNTSHKKDRILVKMHNKFGYALQCFDPATLSKFKDELERVHERASRLTFDAQEVYILFPQLKELNAQNIQNALNGNQVRKQNFHS